jgi:hypothetical protein
MLSAARKPETILKRWSHRKKATLVGVPFDFAQDRFSGTARDPAPRTCDPPAVTIYLIEFVTVIVNRRVHVPDVNPPSAIGILRNQPVTGVRDLRNFS